MNGKLLLRNGHYPPLPGDTKSLFLDDCYQMSKFQEEEERWGRGMEKAEEILTLHLLLEFMLKIQLKLLLVMHGVNFIFFFQVPMRK